MDNPSSDPRCMGCRIPVRHPAIKFCGKVECQKAACKHYGVEYRPWNRSQQAQYEREQAAKRRARPKAPTDSKGYGEHAGRRALNQER